MTCRFVGRQGCSFPARSAAEQGFPALSRAFIVLSTYGNPAEQGFLCHGSGPSESGLRATLSHVRLGGRP